VDLELLNKKITQTLLDLGLTQDEATVMLFMNKKGEMKASEIAKSVGIPRTRLYYVLDDLESKGLLSCTVERPARYSALEMEKAVDFLIKSYKQKLNLLEDARRLVKQDWSLLKQHEVVKNLEPETEDNLQFISGEHRIYSMAGNILKKAVREVTVFMNVRNLSKVSHAEITDKLQELAVNGINVKIMTNTTSCDRSLLEEVNLCSIRDIPHDLNDKAHFIIVDNKELLLLNLDRDKDASGTWTDSGPLVDAMSFLFAVGWRSANLRQRRQELAAN
jgi:sugar-specific transcriptional regulator TrmB